MKEVRGFAMAAQPRARLRELDIPFSMFESYQHEFETPKLRNQDDGHLRDQLLRCVERDMRKALVSKLGAERMTQISSSQLLVEIERISVQKQCDFLNKLKLVKAMQETSEPMRGFMQRLRMLAYA
jgi:hypothetical protein